MKNIDTIKILKACADDSSDIQKVTTESSRGMYKLCGWTNEEINNHFNKNADTKKSINPILNFTDDDILLVAKDSNDKIVGYCYGNKDNDINKIEALYIIEEYHGSGLAKKLYDSTYKYLNSNKDTFLDVFTLNLKGLNFYKKMGFNETGKKTFDKRFTNSAGDMLEITEMKLER